MLPLAAALVAAAGPVLGAGHRDRGSMIAPDDVEWTPAREGSPVHYATLRGDACVGPEDCVLPHHQQVAADFIPREQ